MFELKLRDEFADQGLSNTAVELSSKARDCATQKSAKDFLRITYPTLDILKALRTVGKAEGKPIIVVGERGAGKSHLMATIYFAYKDTEATRKWLNDWAAKGNAACADIQMPSAQMNVICESMHKHNFKNLWDVLLTANEHGRFIKGLWERGGENKTPVPSTELIEEYLEEMPTVLVLDEFQIWFETLDSRKEPHQQRALNFLQILADIATTRPDLLKLVVSVRNGQSEVVTELRRKSHELIDFKAAGAPDAVRRDRRQMLLHRLFENRGNVNPRDIESAIAVHVKELLRLKDNPPDMAETIRQDYVEQWPFSPDLLNILEEEVLVATTAQDTRDLIRILAGMYMGRGKDTCIITAADLRVDDADSGQTCIASLLDILSNQEHRSLRDKALLNIGSLKSALSGRLDTVPHLEELISALWLRSISTGNQPGADQRTLQVDITKDKVINDNKFLEEIETIKENSFNIHKDGNRLLFKEKENPEAKVIATSRNNKEFQDRRDHRYLADMIRSVLLSVSGIPNNHCAVVLPELWHQDPWGFVGEQEKPNTWGEKFTLVVLPEYPPNINEVLGGWLKKYVERNRNTLRFLLPSKVNLYSQSDDGLLGLARKAKLADEWSTEDGYSDLKAKYAKALRDEIGKRYTAFAVLERWDNENPAACLFHIEKLDTIGEKIPEAIQARIKEHLFVPESFEELVVQVAEKNGSMANLIQGMKEPRPKGQLCNPWPGMNEMKERLARLCARNVVVVTQKSGEPLQVSPGESETEAFARIVKRLHDISRPEDNYLSKPSPVLGTGGLGLTEDDDERPTPPSERSQQTGTRREEQSLVNAPTLQTPNPKRETKTYSSPATSPLNLIAKMESWGVKPNAAVGKISLSVTDTTGAQLKEILKKLHEGVTYVLDIEVEEECD